MVHQRVTLSTGVPMDVYAPPAPLDPAKRHPAIVICPGGGYEHLAKREGEPIALRFAGMGFTACVVWYHVAPDRFPKALQDAGCAVACVREHAEEWFVDPNAIAVSGFSAGGHLACHLGVMWHDPQYWAPLGLTCEQVKPNAMVLGYPVISTAASHPGSFTNLSGSPDPAAQEAFSLENHVTADTPPAFLWHTWADPIVPVENTLCLASALYRCGVQAEVHVYPKGPHGAALCNAITDIGGKYILPEAQGWPEMAARFLMEVL